MAEYKPIDLTEEDDELEVVPTTTTQYPALDPDKIEVGETWGELADNQQPWYQPGLDFFEGFNQAVASGAQIPFDVGRAGHQVLFGGDVVPWLPNYDPDQDRKSVV